MVAFVLLRVFLLLLLVAANAFFAAAEFSLVSIRDTRIQQLIDAHRIGAKTVQKLHQNLDLVVNGVQLGITLTSLTLGWFGEPLLARIIEAAIGQVPHVEIYAHAVAVVLAFLLITYMHVILGELVPKSLALQRAEQVALAVAGPMDVFLTISSPFLAFMQRSGGAVLRLFGSREMKRGVVHSPDELKLIVTASRQVGQIPEVQEEMIHNALELDNTAVREVMVPRPDIFSLPADLLLESALERIVEGHHSRIPVYDQQRGPEHIVGVLYTRDLLRWIRLRLTVSPSHPMAARLARMQISRIMRDVLVVPETKVLTDLLAEFKAHRRHLAVVVDEYGSTAGIITVEDVLRQLVGEIEEEESDVDAEDASEEGSALSLEGSVNIRDLESQYDITLKRDAGFETLAGFMLARLQRIPHIGDSLEFEGRRYTVEEMEGHRIARVKIESLATANQQAGGA
jgi:CBS domain containing-hemolysin-like protein